MIAVVLVDPRARRNGGAGFGVVSKVRRARLQSKPVPALPMLRSLELFSYARQVPTWIVCPDETKKPAALAVAR